MLYDLVGMNLFATVHRYKKFPQQGVKSQLSHQFVSLPSLRLDKRANLNLSSQRIHSFNWIQITMMMNYALFHLFPEVTILCHRKQCNKSERQIHINGSIQWPECQ